MPLASFDSQPKGKAAEQRTESIRQKIDAFLKRSAKDITELAEELYEANPFSKAYFIADAASIVFEHSIEEGIQFGEQLRLTPKQWREAILTARVSRKHRDVFSALQQTSEKISALENKTPFSNEGLQMTVPDEELKPFEKQVQKQFEPYAKARMAGFEGKTKNERVETRSIQDKALKHLEFVEYVMRGHYSTAEVFAEWENYFQNHGQAEILASIRDLSKKRQDEQQHEQDEGSIEYFATLVMQGASIDPFADKTGLHAKLMQLANKHKIRLTDEVYRVEQKMLIDGLKKDLEAKTGQELIRDEKTGEYRLKAGVERKEGAELVEMMKYELPPNVHRAIDQNSEFNHGVDVGLLHVGKNRRPAWSLTSARGQTDVYNGDSLLVFLGDNEVLAGEAGILFIQNSEIVYIDEQGKVEKRSKVSKNKVIPFEGGFCHRLDTGTEFYTPHGKFFMLEQGKFDPFPMEITGFTALNKDYCVIKYHRLVRGKNQQIEDVNYIAFLHADKNRPPLILGDSKDYAFSAQLSDHDYVNLPGIINDAASFEAHLTTGIVKDLGFDVERPNNDETCVYTEDENGSPKTARFVSKTKRYSLDFEKMPEKDWKDISHFTLEHLILRADGSFLVAKSIDGSNSDDPETIQVFSSTGKFLNESPNHPITIIEDCESGLEMTLRVTEGKVFVNELPVYDLAPGETVQVKDKKCYLYGHDAAGEGQLKAILEFKNWLSKDAQKSVDPEPEVQANLNLLNAVQNPSADSIRNIPYAFRETYFYKPDHARSKPKLNPFAHQSILKAVQNDSALFQENNASISSASRTKEFALALLERMYPDEMEEYRREQMRFSPSAVFDKAKNALGFAEADPMKLLQPDEATQLLSSSVEDLENRDTIFELRQPMQEFFATGIHSTYDAKKEHWIKSQFQFAKTEQGSGEACTVKIPRLSAGTYTLPLPIGAEILAERVHAIDAKGKEKRLPIRTQPNGHVVVETDTQTKAVAYSFLNQEKTVPQALSEKEFERAMLRAEKSQPEEFKRMRESFGTLPPECSAFINTEDFKQLEPLEKVQAIEQWIRANGYYDPEPKAEADKRRQQSSRPDMVWKHMAERAARVPAAQGKIFAGVCLDFALLQSGMLRKAGFATAIASGFQVNGTKAEGRHAHALSVIAWPNTKGGLEILQSDATPSSTDARAAHVAAPSLAEKREQAEKQQQESQQTAHQELEEILQQIYSADPSVIRKVENGKLERAVQWILAHEVKPTHVKHLQTLFDGYLYTPLKKIMLNTEENQRALQVELEALLQNAAISEKNRAGDESAQKKSGQQLLESVREFREALVKIGRCADEQKATNFIRGLISLSREALSTEEIRAVEAILAYLSTDQMLKAA